MNNKIDLKKKGLKIVKIIIILSILINIFSRINTGVKYGVNYGMYGLTRNILVYIYLLIACYVSTKNIIGPIMGIVYMIYCLVASSISWFKYVIPRFEYGIPMSIIWPQVLGIIINLLLLTGYVTLFTHYINDIKKRSNREYS